MAAGSEGRSGMRRSVRLALMLLLAAVTAFTDLVPTFDIRVAGAQERPRTIMDMLFGPPRRRYIDDPPPRRILRKKPRSQRQKPARASGRTAGASRTPVAGAAGEAVVVKSETAKTVLVVGDFLAGSLAGGLEGAVARNADLKVVSAANGSSGFVRDDHYDWPASIGPLIDEKKPSIVVVLLGSNERQPIRASGESLPLRSDEWTAEYERRADAFAKAVKDKNVPLVWVGAPSFKFDKMSADMAFLNEIYKQTATEAGGEFVDVWEGFVDANGAFAYSGPDIAGQPARLRNSDGITMTPAGSEKLAFFAEKPIFRILGTTADGKAAVAAEALSSAAPAPVANVANATSAPLVALNDPDLDGGDVLLGGNKAGASPEPSPRDKLVVTGTPVPGVAGRADDFDWNAKTTAVVPLKPVDAVIFRGSVDLKQVRQPEPRQPPKAMPSLADAIIDDWAVQQEKGTGPGAAGAAIPQGPAAIPPPANAVSPLADPAAKPASAPAQPVSASPFAQDQRRR